MNKPKVELIRLLPDYWTAVLLFEEINNETFLVSELDISSRVFSHWKTKNLIPFDNDGRTVKLNILEYFWVRVIQDLRHLGFPIETIEKLKNVLFGPASTTNIAISDEGKLLPETVSYAQSKGIDVQELEAAIQEAWQKESSRLRPMLESEVPLFNLLVVSVLASGANISLVINRWGEVEVYYPNPDSPTAEINHRLDLMIENQDYEPILIISLRKYLYQLISDPSSQQKIQPLNILKPVELEVLAALRQGNVSELRIIFGKDSMHKDLVFTYKGKAPAEDLNRISRMFYGKKHTKLEMISNDGKTVLYEYQIRKRHNESNQKGK